MELPIFFILLVFGLSTVTSHPKKSDVLPKDYYKRQILQPIPGYIPVYIKTDEAPLVRREKVKHNENVPVKKELEPVEGKIEPSKDGDVSNAKEEKPVKEKLETSIKEDAAKLEKDESQKVEEKYEKLKNKVPAIERAVPF